MIVRYVLPASRFPCVHSRLRCKMRTPFKITTKSVWRRADSETRSTSAHLVRRLNLKVTKPHPCVNRRFPTTDDYLQHRETSFYSPSAHLRIAPADVYKPRTAK